MYSKDELSAKSVVQLKDIAKEIGAKIKSGDNKETIIYTILDAQAEMPSEQPAQKRKRARISTKKEDRVYSVHGTEGENFDVMKSQVKGPESVVSQKADTPAPTSTTKEEPTMSPAELLAQLPPVVDPLAAFPKHRGRKSKAELEAIAAAKAAAIKHQQELQKAMEAAKQEAQASQQDATSNANQTDENTDSLIPEEQFANNGDANNDNELMAMLQAKMNAQNEANHEENTS